MKAKSVTILGLFASIFCLYNGDIELIFIYGLIYMSLAERRRERFGTRSFRNSKDRDRDRVLPVSMWTSEARRRC